MILFLGLLNLEELNLSSNQLTSLTNDLFSDLIKLNRGKSRLFKISQNHFFVTYGLHIGTLVFLKLLDS
jgi:hypothetical protein